jgi:hypothetical protein
VHGGPAHNFMIATIAGLFAWIITLALRAAFEGCDFTHYCP